MPITYTLVSFSLGPGLGIVSHHVATVSTLSIHFHHVEGRSKRSRADLDGRMRNLDSLRFGSRSSNTSKRVVRLEFDRVDTVLVDKDAVKVELHSQTWIP